ncbi:tumor necrosis factor receptor superfamily member 6B-like isoform X2 [Gigantopelta aegis]|nr:tumor necrosis factor receptor superfamily member 6B-like isoform X2 [Gigantopelta aegis]XP_041377192.1 tumor necrosis factor receptor superfamily member 6B-like isoform X2 [Gigantopelta aegis]
MLTFTILFLSAVTTCGFNEKAEDNPYQYNVITDGVKTTCYMCPPGYYVSQHCTKNFSDSTCSHCSPGYFQTNYTQARRCEQCQKCNSWHQETNISCTSTHNAECRCKLGYKWKQHDAFLQEASCMWTGDCPKGYIPNSVSSEHKCVKCQPHQSCFTVPVGGAAAGFSSAWSMVTAIVVLYMI